jgi:hypothetical protein
LCFPQPKCSLVTSFQKANKYNAPQKFLEAGCPISPRFWEKWGPHYELRPALDEALAAYLDWERQDFDEAVEGIRAGHEDVIAGRTRPAAEFLSELRRKHDLPR